MKTYPLIRTAADRQAVWQGLADGTLDWVCSDHAPHTCEEKHRSFWDAPPESAVSRAFLLCCSPLSTAAC